MEWWQILYLAWEAATILIKEIADALAAPSAPPDPPQELVDLVLRLLT